MKNILGTELLDIEKVSQILGMHPKTIRKYIRDGLLKGHKIGGEWRVKVENLESFINKDEYVEEQKKNQMRKLKDFIDGNYDISQSKIEICSIMDIYVEDKGMAEKIMINLMTEINNKNDDSESIRCEYNFEESKNRARFVFWGQPKIISKLLLLANDINI